MPFTYLLMTKNMFWRWLYWYTSGDQWWWHIRLILASFKGVRLTLFTSIWHPNSFPLTPLPPSPISYPILPVALWPLFSMNIYKFLGSHYWFYCAYSCHLFPYHPLKIQQSWIFPHITTQPSPSPAACHPGPHLRGKAPHPKTKFVDFLLSQLSPDHSNLGF